MPSPASVAAGDGRGRTRGRRGGRRGRRLGGLAVAVRGAAGRAVGGRRGGGQRGAGERGGEGGGQARGHLARKVRRDPVRPDRAWSFCAGSERFGERSCAKAAGRERVRQRSCKARRRCPRSARGSRTGVALDDEPFSLSLSHADGVAVVAVRGTVDLYTARELRDLLNDTLPRSRGRSSSTSPSRRSSTPAAWRRSSSRTAGPGATAAASSWSTATAEIARMLEVTGLDSLLSVAAEPAGGDRPAAPAAAGRRRLSRQARVASGSGRSSWRGTSANAMAPARTRTAAPGRKSGAAGVRRARRAARRCGARPWRRACAAPAWRRARSAASPRLRAGARARAPSASAGTAGGPAEAHGARRRRRGPRRSASTPPSLVEVRSLCGRGARRPPHRVPRVAAAAEGTDGDRAGRGTGSRATSAASGSQGP